MFKFLTNLFDENKKLLDSYQKQVNQINALESEMRSLSDSALSQQTAKLKKRIEEKRGQGTTEDKILEEILPEAFATVRETSRRVLGMRHFDVQVLAGIALHYGVITEQKTGEGKTLTVTLPLYLNALLGKGAHLVTVNDYLAELGCGWMGPIYHFLKLRCAVIVHDHSRLYDPDTESEERGDERLEHFAEITRREAYAADITYGTNNEFGFDYLRDNMVQTAQSMVQRLEFGHQYAIVDEADSILIDEARTPLIISMPDTEPTKKYYDFARMVTSLSKDVDYTIDEKARSVSLTDLGVKRVEQKLGVRNLYEEDYNTIHHIEAALKAKTIFQRDKEYIVREGEVVIVDEHTGRLMYGRRYSDGLHQAIEAKENVKIQQESRTLATISIQNYFRLYTKLSGMTGTAATEAEEFSKIYAIPVVIIPTNQTIIREDKTDIIYKTAAAKYSAIAKHVAEIHAQGRPILIGTRSIEINQIISNFLKRKNIQHQVLNAKNHEKEAFIIADAGKKGAITVATNIAGRGVDIVLGGSKPEIKDFLKAKRSKEIPTTKERKEIQNKYGIQLPPLINPNNYKLSEYAKALETWQAAHDEVVAAGGLYIIGTERHESRRIDNQLRGRSGRQGDPGTSLFYVSLEDEIMRIFGGEQISKVMDLLKIEEDQPIEHNMVSKAIESAQVKVEGFFFDQRKRLVEFDDVMNKQREIIYARRLRLLLQTESILGEKNEVSAIADRLSEQNEETVTEQILGYIGDEVASIVSVHMPKHFTPAEYAALIKEFSTIVPFDHASQEQLIKSISGITTATDLEERLIEIAQEAYQSREKQMGENNFRQLERRVTLATIDEKWMDHLDAMESLRQGIWLRGDKRTVLSEYKKEGFAMFDGLIANIESTIASHMFRAQLIPQSQQQAPLKNIIETGPSPKETSISQVVEAAAAPAKPASRNGSVSDMAAVFGSAKAKSAPKPGSAQVKIKRNDPCPCGSGLKYKKCGLIQAPQHRS